MSQLRYAFAPPKFPGALALRAAGAQPFPVRLQQAFTHYLKGLPQDVFPAPLWEKYRHFAEPLSEIMTGSDDRSAAENWSNKLSNANARRMIEEIAAIEYALAQFHHSDER
jgi:hypothetical protein